jgi:hypothetical protein
MSVANRKFKFVFKGYDILNPDGTVFAEVYGAGFPNQDYSQIQMLQHMVDDAAAKLLEMGDASISK